MKVTVDKVLPAYKTVKLPVPGGDESVTLLGQAIGSFFQWPQCKISRMKEITPTSKNKDQQMKTTMPTSVLALEIDLVAENTTSAPILQQKDALKNAQKAVQQADVQNAPVQKAAVQKAVVQKAAVQKADVQKADVQKPLFKKPLFKNLLFKKPLPK